MAKPDFPGDWKVIASTSRFFPVQATVVLERKPRDSSSFALTVVWETQEMQLFDEAFPEDPPGTFGGSFKHPKKPGSEELFEFSVTVSPGPEKKKKRYLFGVVSDPGQGIDSGGTGVWVAEEQQQPPEDPPDKCT